MAEAVHFILKDIEKPPPGPRAKFVGGVLCEAKFMDAHMEFVEDLVDIMIACGDGNRAMCAIRKRIPFVGFSAISFSNKLNSSIQLHLHMVAGKHLR
eukprot:6164005-Amphidinium_carterae.1